MRAIAIEQFGGRDQLKLMDLPKPAPGRGEVLVRVKAAGVNPVDYKLREGQRKNVLPHQFPLILGWDAAGIVEAVGPGVGSEVAGMEVFAYCRKPIVQHGAYAEYIVLPVGHIARKPRNLSFEEAASIPLAGLTAYQSLFDAAGLKRGQTVLIHAAAGGVGGFAVQLAKSAGAQVIATASAPNHDYVRKLGADELIDYTRVDFRDAVRAKHPDGVDVVFDTVGDDVQVKSADVVRKGGVLVSILTYADEQALAARGIVTKYVFVAPNADQLSELAELAEAGKLKTHLAAVWPLEQAAKAHEMIESRHVRGKIVLKI